MFNFVATKHNMAIKLFIPLFLLVSLSLGCSQYPLSGNIDMTDSNKNPKVYLVNPSHFNSLVSSYEGKVIDSATIDNKGNFKFDKMPTTKENWLYLLTIQRPGEKYANRLENDSVEVSNYIPFIYRSSAFVKINSSAKHLLKNADIQGSITENTAIQQLVTQRFELLNIHFSQKEIKNEENLLEHEQTLYNYQKALLASVSDNQNPAINALALRWVSPNGDYERIPELVKQTCQKLKASSPNHPWTIQICQKSNTLPLTPGDVFPDFPMPMMNGDTVMLHTLFGKKLTMLDLWASWCAPCRHENRNILVPLWDKYHNNGFQIVGYALDASEKGWKNAIEKDGANRWPHASHLKGDESPLFELLKISTIPANYLIDDKGIIVAKNIHGDELQKWVKEYF